MYIAFRDKVVKSRAERFLISITNAIEMVLERSVEVRMILLPDSGGADTVRSPNMAGQKQNKSSVANNMDVEGFANSDSHRELAIVPRANLNGGSNSSLLLDNRSPSILDQSNDNKANVRRHEFPTQRIESIIREQRLESAWLQAAERSTPRSISRLRPEKNQVLPQEGIYSKNQSESLDPAELTSSHWDDELNHEINALKGIDVKIYQNDQTGKRVDPLPISPSLLHQSGFTSNLSKDYQ